ncbi:MAG: hypothetical protein ACI30J_08860 [Paludibacteraceae bacterium]
MELDIIGKCDFSAVNKEIKSTTQHISNLEKELSSIDFDMLKSNLSNSLRINYKALGINEMKSEYQSLKEQIGTIAGASEKYKEILSSYQNIIENIREKQKALNDEYVRAANAQDSKTMIECRQELRSLGNEYSSTISKIKEYEEKLQELNKMSAQAGDRLDTFGKQVRENSIFEFEVKDMSKSALEDRLLRLKSISYEAKDSIEELNNVIDSKSKTLSSPEGERSEKKSALDSGTLDASQTEEYKTRVEELDRAISSTKENIANLQSTVSSYENQMSLADEATSKIEKQLISIGASNPFDTHKMSVEELKTAVEQANIEVEKQQNAQRKANAELEQAEKSHERYKQLVASTGDVYVRSGYIKSEREAAELVEQRRKKLEEVNRELDKSVTKQRIYNESLQSKSGGNDADTTSVSGKMNSLQSSMLGLSKSIGQITTGFKNLSKGGTGVAKGITMITAGVKGLGKALLGLLANPIVATIAAIVAVIVLAGKMLSNFFTNMVEGADKFASIKGIFEGVKAAIENFINGVSKKFGEFVTSFDKLGNIFTSLGVLIKNWFSNVFTWLSNAATGLGNWFVGLKDAADSFFRGDGFDTSGMEHAFDGINDGLQDLGDSYESLKKANEEYKKSFDSWDSASVGEFVDTYKRLADEARAMEKEQFAWNKTSAQLDSEKAALQETMYSGGKLQQLEAMNRMRDIVNQKYAKELEFAERELDTQKQKNALAGKNVSIDQLKAQQDLESKVLNLQSQRNSELRTMARRYKSVTDELYNQQKAHEKELARLQEQNAATSRNAQQDEMIRSLEFQKKYASDLNTQLELQKRLREENLKKQLEQLEAEKKSALLQIEEDKKTNIRNVYGEEALKRYERGEQIEDSQGIVAFYDKKSSMTAANYAQKQDVARRESDQKGAYDDLSADIDAYTDYVEQIIELEQWKSEQLQAIRDGESALTAQQIEEVYQQQKGQLQEQNGIDDMEGAAADISANLATALSNATWEEIKRIGEEAMAQLDEQIAALEAQKQSASEELGRQAGTDENGNEVSATGVYAEIAQAEADIAAGKEGAQERLNSLREREQQLTTQIQTADGNSIKLGKQKKRVQEQVNKATKDGTNQTQKLTKAQKWGVVAESLSTVNDALNVLADTMGGSLSKKSKKAVESLQTVVSFATQNIKGIETLVDVASKGMSATANGAAEAMSAAEKASVILTIISLAVQAIQAIVNIAMKYSESAKMQEAIDAQLERVDKLKRKNEDLQRSYKDSTGVDYYKGMARAAKDYTNIINAQKKALQEAEALYERQRAKYGEDSDKTKEAEQQVEDIQDGLNDLADEQADILQELRDSLLTTDLTTFSENLADSLVEGFENGKEGIADTWDDMLNDLLTSLLKKQLALQLEKQFESVFNKMNNMADDGVLTQSEIDEIVELMNGASEGAKQIAEAYYDVMDEMGLLTDTDNTGSKGGFEGMSQDTADELNARFTALQITGANIDATVQGMSQQVSEMSAGERIKTTLLQTLQENSLLGVQIAQNQLDQLRIIADNTGLLTETNRRLHAIEQHTSKL